MTVMSLDFFAYDLPCCTADLLHSLLQDSTATNQNQGGLQIGGDYLDSYDPVGLAADNYFLGRT